MSIVAFEFKTREGITYDSIKGGIMKAFEESSLLEEPHSQRHTMLSGMMQHGFERVSDFEGVSPFFPLHPVSDWFIPVFIESELYPIDYILSTKLIEVLGGGVKRKTVPDGVMCNKILKAAPKERMDRFNHF